jgi:lipoic acid synthetase
VVLTSVTRDDLEDGGAGIFAGAVTEIKKDNPGVKVEVLISDLKGDEAALRIIVESKPEVLAHNVEIVPSLYSKIRPEAVYARSLKLLKKAKAMDGSIKTKSGLMLGLGEKKEEVVEVLKDLRKAGVDIVTIGQYLSPDRACVPVVRHLASEEFEEYKKIAESMSFSGVASGTFVRSSYNAENLADLTGELH